MARLRILLLPITLVFQVVCSYGQDYTWIKQTNGPNSASSVAISADGRYLAGGFGLNLWTSCDYGMTWNQNTNLIPSSPIKCISISSNGTCLVAGTLSGFLYGSTNRGETWTQFTSLGTNIWMSVANSRDGSHIIAGQGYYTVSDGYVFTSPDYGATWVRSISKGYQDAPDIGEWGNVVMSPDGTSLIAAGSGLFSSTNFGVTWTHQTWTGNQFLFLSETNLLMLYGASLYRSSDSGNTWQYVNGVPGNHIVASSDGRWIIATVTWGGNEQYISISADAGATWTTLRAYPGFGQWNATTAISADGSIVLASASYLWIGSFQGGITNLCGYSDGSKMIVELKGTPRSLHSVESVDNLTPALSWHRLGSELADTNGIWRFEDTNIASPTRFYRVTTP